MIVHLFRGLSEAGAFLDYQEYFLYNTEKKK